MTLETLIASASISIIPLGFIIPQTFWQCGGNIAGVYVDNHIYVCESGEMTEFYKQHEIGHLVEERYLTKEQREEYKKLYEKHHKIGKRAFQRDYGHTNWQEGWADDYAYMKTKQKVNIFTKKRIKLISSFLK